MLLLVAAMIAGSLSCALFIFEVLDFTERYRHRAQAGKHARGESSMSAHVSVGQMLRQKALGLSERLPLFSKLLKAIGSLSETKELERLQDQIPLALDSLSVAVGSGLSLTQAFERVASETKEPLASKLTIVPQGIQAGLSMRESLERLQSEFPEGGMETLFVTLELHYRTGGNLAILLERTAVMQREDNELRRELNVKTAQARFSAKIVGILPLALLAALALFSTDYIATFFSSITGFVILVVALFMEGAGYVLVKRASEVELS